MPVNVQDNFLDKDYFKKLQSVVFSDDFPWFLTTYLDGKKDVQPPTEPELMMVHLAYASRSPITVKRTEFYDQLGPFFNLLDRFSVLRVKLNLQPRTEKITEPTELHIDVPSAPDNAVTSILYMNTNNGYTKLETGEKISSVENRLVTFPMNLRHTGSSNNCESLYRSVMNIGWIPNTWGGINYKGKNNGE